MLDDRGSLRQSSLERMCIVVHHTWHKSRLVLRWAAMGCITLSNITMSNLMIVTLWWLHYDEHQSVRHLNQLNSRLIECRPRSPIIVIFTSMADRTFSMSAPIRRRIPENYYHQGQAKCVSGAIGWSNRRCRFGEQSTATVFLVVRTRSGRIQRRMAFSKTLNCL